MTVEGGEMSENVDPAGSAAVSSTATAVGAAAPSCYRLSVLSGSLEVSARLKSSEDLELLMKVLEANKALFAKTDRSEPEAFSRADRPATKTLAKADRPATKTLAGADRRAIKTLAKADRPATKAFAKADRSEPGGFSRADQSEDEILTLT
jgi:hypothetical protein